MNKYDLLKGERAGKKYGRRLFKLTTFEIRYKEQMNKYVLLYCKRARKKMTDEFSNLQQKGKLIGRRLFKLKKFQV